MNYVVDLSFPVSGTELWADQNHRLLAALCNASPEIHQVEGIAINTITGIPSQKKQGVIVLSSRSKLVFRLPVEAIRYVYPLVGQTLNVGGYSIQLGNPELQPLKPVDVLKARLVTIKGYTEVDTFLDAAQRQLDALEIQANLGIPANRQGEPKRLTLRISKAERTYTIVGFSLVVSDLSPEDSIKLQVQGLGGKRRIGCGIFNPAINVYRKVRRENHAATTSC